VRKNENQQNCHSHDSFPSLAGMISRVAGRTIMHDRNEIRRAGSAEIMRYSQPGSRDRQTTSRASCPHPPIGRSFPLGGDHPR
jgi:hypothetical protein